jgi:hypothetical protein
MRHQSIRAMFLRQFLRRVGTPAEQDENAFLNSSVRQRPQELAHGLHPHLPRLPLFALNGRFSLGRFNDQINAAVRICSTATRHEFAYR